MAKVDAEHKTWARPATGYGGALLGKTACSTGYGVITRAGTNTPSDEYDSYREYRVANTNMYSRIHFFSEAKLGNGLSVLVSVRLYDVPVLRSEVSFCKPSLYLGKPKNFQTVDLYLAGGSPISTTFLSMIANIPVPYYQTFKIKKVC